MYTSSELIALFLSCALSALAPELCAMEMLSLSHRFTSESLHGRASFANASPFTSAALAAVQAAASSSSTLQSHRAASTASNSNLYQLPTWGVAARARAAGPLALFVVRSCLPPPP
jgi:hypothetical protein